MKETRILLFDHGGDSDWAATLKSHLAAAAPEGLCVQHERLAMPAASNPPLMLGRMIESLRPHLLLLLVANAGSRDQEALLTDVLGLPDVPPVVVVTDTGEPRILHRLFELGAADFLIPPLRPVEIWPRLRRFLDLHREQNTEISHLRTNLGLQQFVGESPALLESLRKIPCIARSDAGVLITGETGTGKEVCARAIHYLSARADHPFLPLNCGAIPADLVENELFGHEAGAYTSAETAHAGVIGQAHGGTLFLDEIDSLPLAAQVKLLRFLQDKEYRPLGARKAVQADVRIIAASNGRIEDLVQSGRMRKDLFYRLNVLPLQLPPLRERAEDIPLLARHFASKFAGDRDGAARDIAPAALHKLSLHDWPGNVRELQNVIERAVVLSTGKVIQSGDIQLPLDCEQEPISESFGLRKTRMVAEFERGYLRMLLEQHRGNIAQAARAAQKNRRVFFQLMRKHHIRVEHVAATHGGPPVVKIVIDVDKNVHHSDRH